MCSMMRENAIAKLVKKNDYARKEHKKTAKGKALGGVSQFFNFVLTKKLDLLSNGCVSSSCVNGSSVSCVNNSCVRISSRSCALVLVAT